MHIIYSQISNITLLNIILSKPEQSSGWIKSEQKANYEFDNFSVEPIVWVRGRHESESGQIMLKKQNQSKVVVESE